MTAEHSGQHAARDGEIGSAKEDPGDANGSVSCKPSQHPNDWRVRPRLLFKEEPANPLDNQIRTVQQTPDDKCPGGAVPEAADEHHDHEIERGAKWPDL